MILTFFKSLRQLFCRTYCNLYLSDCFLMVGFSLNFLSLSVSSASLANATGTFPLRCLHFRCPEALGHLPATQTPRAARRPREPAGKGQSFDLGRGHCLWQLPTSGGHSCGAPKAEAVTSPFYQARWVATRSPMAAVTLCSDFEAPKKQSLTLFSLFPHLFPMKWWARCHDLRFLNVEL